MSLFNSLTFTYYQESTGSYDAGGVWVPGTQSNSTFTGTLHPLSGQDMEALPRGRDNRNTYKIIAGQNIALTAADPKVQKNGDIITAPDGTEYEIIQVKPWTNNIISHKEFVVQPLPRTRSVQ